MDADEDTVGFIAQQKQPHSQVTGMDITGEWTGMFYQKAIDGRIH